jgi:hypothetical protein
MIEYLQSMLELVLRKELQGIHFWATLYVLFVLIGSLWHVLRVRTWPSTEGQLLQIGIRPLGTPDLQTNHQDYVPGALYEYQVNGNYYEGQDISVWKMSASGMLKNAAYLLPKQVQVDAFGKVIVHYNPKCPRKSLLLRPGWASIIFLCLLMIITTGFYIWCW